MSAEPPLPVPLSSMVEVNPRQPLHKLRPGDLVSFIPMSDVSESGEWVGREVRRLRDVSAGFTPFVEGDVLIAKITPCMENGKGAHAIGLSNGVGFGSTEFHVLRSGRETASRFVFHWSQAPALRKRAEAYMIGSAGQQRVQADFFDKFLVPRLPRPEQVRVAEILDTLDEAIRSTERAVAKLRRLKQGLVHDLLTRGIDENGEVRDLIDNPEQFQDSPVGRIPRDWVWCNLNSVVPKSEYGISVALGHRGAIPVLRMMNFAEGEADLRDLKFSDGREARGLLLRSGDVLFNRTNSIDHVGRTGIWRGQLEQASFASYLVRLVPDTGRLTAEFLNRWLNWDATQIRIRQWATPSVSQVNINPTNLGKTLIALPKTLAEQDRISSALLAQDGEIRAVKRELEKVKLVKQGLMDDLLTGRVRVTVPRS